MAKAIHAANTQGNTVTVNRVFQSIRRVIAFIMPSKENGSLH